VTIVEGEIKALGEDEKHYKIRCAQNIHYIANYIAKVSHIGATSQSPGRCSHS
jgi:hypothetical protein